MSWLELWYEVHIINDPYEPTCINDEHKYNLSDVTGGISGANICSRALQP